MDTRNLLLVQALDAATRTFEPQRQILARLIFFIRLQGDGVMAFFAFVVWALSTDSETAAGLVAVPVWLAVLWVSWFFVRRTESHQQACAWFKREVSEPETAAPSDS